MDYFRTVDRFAFGFHPGTVKTIPRKHVTISKIVKFKNHRPPFFSNSSYRQKQNSWLHRYDGMFTWCDIRQQIIERGTPQCSMTTHPRGCDNVRLMTLEGARVSSCSWCLLCGGEWVPEDEDDRVSTQEHLRNVTILVDWLRLLLALPLLGNLCPHLLHILQHHVAVSANINQCLKTWND